LKHTVIVALTFFFLRAAAPAALSQSAKMPTSSADTPVPTLVSFAGSAIDAQGKPLGGAAAITFQIFKEDQGGEPLWSETQNVAFDGAGHYRTELGAASPNGIPVELFGTGESRWLQIEIAGQLAQPRVLLVSVPYALKAADSQTLAGRAASDYVTREQLQAAMAAIAANASSPAQVHPEQSPTGSGTAGFVPLWTGASTLGNSVLSETGTSIGIDTAAPATTLDVNGGSTLRGNISMPAVGTATAAGGFSSPVFAMSASSFLDGGAAVNQKFAWEVQPVGNNTASPSSVLSLLYGSGTNGVSNTGLQIFPSGSINTKANVRVAPSAAATASGGKSSSQFMMEAEAFNSSSASSVPQQFALAAAPAANNTPSPSANLELLFSSGSASATPTGLSFSPTGVISFVPGQTFPASQLETTLNDIYAQLGAPNTFTQPITFATGQTFPGTIASISPGTGLFTTIVPSTGAVTVGVDTTQVPLLSKFNNFGDGLQVERTFEVLGNPGFNSGLANFGSSGAADSNSMLVFNGDGENETFVSGCSGCFIPGTQAGDGGMRILPLPQNAPGRNLFFGDSTRSRLELDSAGNALQPRTGGGMVKAMFLFSPNGGGHFVRCFSSALSGEAAITPPCGFAVIDKFIGDYVLDLGFQIDDRILSATGGEGDFSGTVSVCTDLQGGDCNNPSALTTHRIEVTNCCTNNVDYDTLVYMVVF